MKVRVEKVKNLDMRGGTAYVVRTSGVKDSLVVFLDCCQFSFKFFFTWWKNGGGVEFDGVSVDELERLALFPRNVNGEVQWVAFFTDYDDAVLVLVDDGESDVEWIVRVFWAKFPVFITGDSKWKPLEVFEIDLSAMTSG